MDRTDRAILKALQADGRITTLELATKANLSPTATADRVKRLTREGYIEGYSARLSAEKLDLGLLVFVEVKLDRTTPDVFDQFAAAVRRASEVMECHMVAGGFDYLIKARVRDMNAYRAFLSDSLLSLPGVRETHTYAVMEEVKNTDLLPL
jgi:Lrp/AsnC family leucine-responsive transcriptional regulator